MLLFADCVLSWRQQALDSWVLCPKAENSAFQTQVPQPFNTAKVHKKTHRVVAQRPTELDVMHSSMDRGNSEVLRAALLFAGGHQA